MSVQTRPFDDSPGEPALCVSFVNSRGLRLSGMLLTPASASPHPAVVVAHGWGSGRSSPRNRAVTETLLDRGIAAFLFDFTGRGESQGRAEDSTLDQQVDDLGAAIGALGGLDEVDGGRIGVLGAGSGGAVAILRAATDARIRALAVRAADPEGAEDAAAAVKIPTLLVVGETDIPIRSANERVLGRLAGLARLVVVPRGDHLFDDPEALGEAARLTADWFARHL